MKLVSVSLEIQFSCAHFYAQKAWSQEQNSQEFGRCFSTTGHGHDYRLNISVPPEQETDAQTALLNLRDLLDHQHLNHLLQWPSELVPTTENLALFCKDYLLNFEVNLLTLELFENPEISVQITGKQLLHPGL